MTKIMKEYVKYLEDFIPKDIKKYYETPSLKRLTKVGYFCGMDNASKSVYSFKEYVSTYAHSITTAGITSMFTDDRRAILGALFHDVSKPTCSHVIDFMNKDYEKQESTEKFTEEIILNDDLLMTYLYKDGINPKDVINFKQYSIVDLDRPCLCADRIDGILISSMIWSERLTLKEAVIILRDMKLYLNEYGQQEIGFASKFIAQYIMTRNNDIDKLTHSSSDTFMMQLLADIIALALKEELITYEGLYYLTDDMLFKVLEYSTNPVLKEKLNQFYNISKRYIPKTTNDQIKKRLINPLVDGKRFK